MRANRKSALTAGFALILMALAATFSYGYVHSSLVVQGNPETTINNLNSSVLLFRAEVIGWFIIFILDVIAALALYVFFKNENRKLSALAAGFRLIYSIVLGIAILNLFQILNFLNGSISATAGNQIMLNLKSFESNWSFGLIIFGFHLMLLGVLAVKSKYIHNFWGILLIFAAGSYIIIHSAKFFYPEFESRIATAEMVLSLPMAFGEVGFAIWLIIRGGKQQIVFRQPKAVTTNKTFR